jgi:predicted dehydrogenase
VALVGCGEVAERRHIPGFLRLKRGISVVAVCDVDFNKANRVARKFKIPEVYDNFSELLLKETPDIVSVCTPPSTHFPMAMEALAHDCHVLLEKPMALTVDECEKMISTAEKKGLKLCVVHNQRFYPPYLKAQELIHAGEIGVLTNMRIFFAVPQSQYIANEHHWINKLPGGPVEECGPHPVYLALPFLKKVKSVTVTARKTTSYPWVSFDNYYILLEGQDLICQIINSYNGDLTINEIDFIGNQGVLKLDLQTMILTFSRGQKLEPMASNIRTAGVLLASHSLKIAGQIAMNVMSNALMAISGRTFVGHYILIEKFVNSVVHDVDVPVSPEEGRETVRIMNEIVRQVSKVR